VQEDIFHAIKAIIATQRDYGRRDDRKQARLKYLVSEWGIDKFRGVVEQYLGKRFEQFRPLPPWKFYDYLGWHEQGDGNLFVGCFVQNGRLKGTMKAGLRSIIDEYNLSVRLTPNQNLLLCDIQPAWKAAIDSALRAAGVTPPLELDSLDRNSMACPALPLCGLAIGEAERALPDINRRVRNLLSKVGLEGETLVMRMTGCANGCVLHTWQVLALHVFCLQRSLVGLSHPLGTRNIVPNKTFKLLYLQTFCG
jgi:sulfite reductase (ferredoxin)